MREASPTSSDWERELPDLMVRYQQADARAVARLIELLSPRLLRSFGATRATRHEAEDLLQDCWIRIHRSRHTYRAPEPVLPWVFAIARHTRLDGYRRTRRRDAREVSMAVIPERSAPAASDPDADGRALRLLAALPDSQRDVIVMLKVTGMSLEDVARATGSTIGAVKQKAHRAYTRLREILGREKA
ncbi:MAG TPA: RNA polymerase sigma factor [Vicinamibacterales bacterium]|nr:RNA polymerase sigma factor [Vicinamibacterales bacterium]